jgi:hypothetical protein
MPPAAVAEPAGGNSRGCHGLVLGDLGSNWRDQALVAGPFAFAERARDGVQVELLPWG